MQSTIYGKNSPVQQILTIYNNLLCHLVGGGGYNMDYGLVSRVWWYGVTFPKFYFLQLPKYSQVDVANGFGLCNGHFLHN